MPSDFLHYNQDFSDLLNILADEKSIQPALIEKDYWLMHVLYGLLCSVILYKMQSLM
jgi:hypothetical protein